MKTNPDVKPVFRSILACALAMGFSVRLANAQDAAVPETEAATEYAPLPAIGSPASDLDFQTYRLSYMQGDRVIALLKALGYATVEFAAAQGESVDETVYTVLQEVDGYPLIIKFIDANKTSLMAPAIDGGGGEVSGLGGTYLHQQTSGAPEQRLFIVYEKAYPEQMHALMQLLRNDIDVPARQVVIEALVVEVDTDKMDELGVNYALQRRDFSLSLPADQSTVPFVGRFDDVLGNWEDDWGALPGVGFSAGLRALTQTDHAEILSNPSVLVLNGRQARIQVGQQVPTSTAVATNTHVRSGVTYLQTGIVLNLRPRISEDGSEVTMQIETIVSSVNPAKREHKSDTSVLLAPVVDNRQVQTFVRVADNTPFIVGGLIASNKNNSNSGMPFLSKIPYLGNLFKRSIKKNGKREVIVVLTPHVIDTGEKSFSYVIPKDSETFDSFDHILFRNAYRIRDDDVFDLTFATQSNYFKSILGELKTFQDEHFELFEKEPVFGYLHDKVPGEEVIVRRMIWEIVHKAKYHHYISEDHILVFEANDDAEFGNKFKTLLLGNILRDLNSGDENALVLDYADHKAKTAGPFEHPRALISRTNVSNPNNYVEQISVLNSDDLERNTILLSNAVSPPGVRGATALEVLKGVLVLKRILALNHSMPVTINEFRVGRQVIFPTEQELRDKYHIIDYDVARFFYQVINYYPEFESAFNRDSDAILERMKELSDAGAQ
jgi:general secretion pathway protein D